MQFLIIFKQFWMDLARIDLNWYPIQHMTGSTRVGPETHRKASFFTWDWKPGMVSSEQARVLQFWYKTTGTNLWYLQMISPKRFAIRITIFEIWALYDERFEVEILAKSQDLRLAIVFINYQLGARPCVPRSKWCISARTSSETIWRLFYLKQK